MLKAPPPVVHMRDGVRGMWNSCGPNLKPNPSPPLPSFHPSIWRKMVLVWGIRRKGEEERGRVGVDTWSVVVYKINFKICSSDPFQGIRAHKS
ncbi:hypothetical protein L1987_22446 [Smallanthus sonchifolius]|uniref:Uncharacterized protein n=1 Tax=Smallanthus sonchifolius TaxID=185202 RepID=A0ACB9IF26_9ASTR|nr:hypothetical protein L1987_22446 [Smallanthus sonchifolius]